jgi:hypothetical protein
LRRSLSNSPLMPGFSIGAPGFEPGTSPTRIMGETWDQLEEVPANRKVPFWRTLFADSRISWSIPGV